MSLSPQGYDSVDNCRGAFGACFALSAIRALLPVRWSAAGLTACIEVTASRHDCSSWRQLGSQRVPCKPACRTPFPAPSAPPQLFPKLSVSERQALLKLADAAVRQFERSAPNAERALSSCGSPTKRQRQEGAPSRPPQQLMLPLHLMGDELMTDLWVLGEDR